jgi:TetR/AcrR family transcriptional repressor of nem operon
MSASLPDMPRTGRPREFDEDVAINAAKDLFWSRGYTATSIRDLVPVLGLRSGSLYGAFGGKRSLFLRALRRYAAEGDAALDRWPPDSPVLPQLRAV